MIINTALKQKQLKGSIQPFNLSKHKTGISTSYICWFKAAYNLKIIYCIILSSRMFISPLFSFWDTFPFVQCVLFGSPSICQISPGIKSTVCTHSALRDFFRLFLLQLFIFFLPPLQTSVWETAGEHYWRAWSKGTDHMANDDADVSILHEWKKRVKTLASYPLDGLTLSFRMFSLCNKTIGPAL